MLHHAGLVDPAGSSSAYVDAVATKIHAVASEVGVLANKVNAAASEELALTA
jgi:outer membrane murein-binding lipoprotein Lpp